MQAVPKVGGGFGLAHWQHNGDSVAEERDFHRRSPEVPTKVLGILLLITVKPSHPPALPMPSSSIIWRDPMASGNAEQEEHAAPHDSHQRKPPCKYCRGYFKESEIKIETSPGELNPFTSFAAHLPCFPLDLPLSPVTKDMPCGSQEPTHQT